MDMSIFVFFCVKVLIGMSFCFSANVNLFVRSFRKGEVPYERIIMGLLYSIAKFIDVDAWVRTHREVLINSDVLPFIRVRCL